MQETKNYVTIIQDSKNNAMSPIQLLTTSMLLDFAYKPVISALCHLGIVTSEEYFDLHI